MAFEDYFSVQVYFLVFRETLESAVIVSVLLSFLRQGFGNGRKLSDRDQKVYNTLYWQVWLGAIMGIIACILIGGAFVVIFYTVGTNVWNTAEKLWEAFFCILASVMITFMGIKMLRINKLKTKWRMKLAQAIVDTQGDGSAKTTAERSASLQKRYGLAILPFVTTLREGLEAVAFLGGLGASQPSTSFPLAVIAAVATGSIIGVFMYRYGSHVSIRAFLIMSTCFLYLVAAGLFSRGIWFLETDIFIRKVGSDVTELGSGPGSYDITHSVWHVNCCNPETDGFWMIFNGLLGWQNSATYGSVLSYNLYWFGIMFLILRLQYLERRGVGKHARVVEDRSLIDRATHAMAAHEDEESVHLDRTNSIDSNTPLVA